MTNFIFNLCNITILLFWGLIIFLPKFHFTLKIIKFPWVPIIIGVFYSYFIILSGALIDFDFTSLEGILELFKKATPESAAAGWLHYLAFDFWVGCWIVRHSQKNELNHGIIVLPLLGTLMLGPVGLILYGMIFLFNNLKK